MFNKFHFVIFALLSLMTISCGSGADSDDLNMSDSQQSQTDSLAASETSLVANPIPKSTETFGVDGNLWKPVSDETASGGGNLVVLLSSKFTEQFESCELRTITGETVQLFCLNTVEWTQIPFSCFSNGNRQTWRANFRCSQAAEVRVVCREQKQEVEFTVPEQVRGQVCSRFG